MMRGGGGLHHVNGRVNYESIWRGYKIEENTDG